MPPRPLNRDGAAPREGAGDPARLSLELLAAAREAAGGGEGGRVGELAAALREVDPATLGEDAERLAFWINLYNALLLHRIGKRPLRGSIVRQPWLFSSVAYEVGGMAFSLDLIEHGVLRRNSRPPYRARRPLRHGDERLLVLPRRLDPRVHFALNCGARSCPPITAYEPEQLPEQLEAATRAYLGAETAVDGYRGEVTLPRLMRLYRADFGDRAEQLDLAARHVLDLQRVRGERGGHVEVRYGRFDWRVASHAASPSS